MAGTRPRILSAAIVSVMIGSGGAAGTGGFSFWRGALGLVVALALQVGVNYANDYSDGIRDTDAIGMRVGPMRLVGSGLAEPVSGKGAAGSTRAMNASMTRQPWTASAGTPWPCG